jgi:hypothetical protein
MAGEGRYITAYNGTTQITVSPVWATDPGNCDFVIFSSGLKIVPTALGTDGTTVTDSASTVLGAIGANNANNAFLSSAVVSDADGSVLERQEYLQTQVGYGVLAIEADAGSDASNIIDAAALTQTNAAWWKGALLVSINGTLQGQSRPVVAFNTGTDTITVYPAFTAAPTVDDDFLLVSSWRPNTWHQQSVVTGTVNAVVGVADIFDLSVAGFSYMVNDLHIKCADPGADTVYVKLYELINAVDTLVSTHTITTVNYATIFSLMDMFGLEHLAGDNLHITVTSSAGTYAVAYKYHYALSYTG